MIPFYLPTERGRELIEPRAFIFHIVVFDPMRYEYAQQKLMRKFRAFIERERATPLRFLIVRSKDPVGDVIQFRGLAVCRPIREEARRRAIQHPSVRGWKP